MTNAEILEKAIQKAIDNGWHSYNSYTARELAFANWEYPNNIIFDHDFAKALWGEDLENYNFKQKAFGEYRPAWQGHLMQMVISDDPIKYLEENI